eukprot:scaffold73455_cov67-Phaeocystis_antarctica.AAC.5
MPRAPSPGCFAVRHQWQQPRRVHPRRPPRRSSPPAPPQRQRLPRHPHPLSMWSMRSYACPPPAAA